MSRYSRATNLVTNLVHTRIKNRGTPSQSRRRSGLDQRCMNTSQSYSVSIHHEGIVYNLQPWGREFDPRQVHQLTIWFQTT